jgi:mannan endo-1,4-beta-mannosidase
MRKMPVIVLFLFSLNVCNPKVAGGGKSILNNSPEKIAGKDNTPCNQNAHENTKAVLRYIAYHSGQPFKAVLSGQSCGHTPNIYKPEDMMGYELMVEKLYKATGKYPAIIALDYEHDKICKSEEISKANQILIHYWNDGGLVAVGMSPQNPWLNDESNLDSDSGNWSLTRTNQLTKEQLCMINLNDLINPEKPVYKSWRRKLDRIASGLEELQDAGVVVLFKPLQEMNGSWFWWGVLSHKDDPSPYVNLYRDMYTYFTKEKGLNNIIWMFSPLNSTFNYNSADVRIVPQMFNYPGDDYVDIIAPTAYNNSLDIAGYSDLVSTGKPLAMAEFGPDHKDNHGGFDNTKYIERISSDYPGFAFWISWHDWSNGDGTNTYMSLIGNKNARELIQNPGVLTRENIAWKIFFEK